MRVRSIVLAGTVAAAALGSGACVIERVYEPPLGCDLPGTRPCESLRMVQLANGPIKGDTVRVAVVSDSGYERNIIWSITGAAELVPGSEIRPSDGLVGNREQSILVRGMSVGLATVKAAHVYSARSASLALAVLDSSVITHLRLFAVSSGSKAANGLSGFTDSVHVGDSLFVSGPSGSDDAGRTYPIEPDGWASSDTAVATIALHPQAIHAWRVVLRARAPGAVDVIASFAGLRETLRVKVLP